jgi:MFS family permease
LNDAPRLYTPQFFQVLIAAMLTMVGVSMQFHFGEYVADRGYSVQTLGWIIGFGVVGSIALRPWAGAWIDRVGCRTCFIVSALVGACANLSFQFLTDAWTICIARMAMQACNATFLATVAVFAARVAPRERRAESLGTIGIGGFLGMMIGPALGDAVFSSGLSHDQRFGLFFAVVAGMTLCAGATVFTLAEPDRIPVSRRPQMIALLRAHWPGSIVLLPMAFASVLIIHMTFLERFADARGFGNIRCFFFVYSITAIILRLLFRKVPQRLGRTRVCVGGLSLLAMGLLLLIPVHAEWHLIFPAFVMGAGHSFTFPSMIDLVAETMPIEHRGFGTSLALGSMDVGFLLGGVAWGNLIDRGGFVTTFVSAAGVALGTAGWFAWSRRRAAVR